MPYISKKQVACQAGAAAITTVSGVAVSKVVGDMTEIKHPRISSYYRKGLRPRRIITSFMVTFVLGVALKEMQLQQSV